MNEPERRLNLGLLLNYLAKDNPDMWADFWHTAYIGYDNHLKEKLTQKSLQYAQVRTGPQF